MARMGSIGRSGVRLAPAVAWLVALASGCGGDDASETLDDVGAPGDAATEGDASIADADAGAADVSQEAPAEASLDAAHDAPADGDGSSCDPPTFDYLCDPADAGSCPSGLCILGQCIAPLVDPHRWDGCGDGACGACETPTTCPADCASPPTVTGQKAYDDPSTITVWVHGFTNNTADKLKSVVYGGVKGCGDLGNITHDFGIARPCGDVSPTAPNQLIAVEYYGATPAAFLSAADVAEIEQYPYLGGPTGLPRYARVVAKFIRERLATTGATHVNLACHSMGCLISRYVIENDLEHLASDGRIVRWVTSAGVLAGARLARLYDNPAIQQAAGLIGLAVDDFAAMNPDYVQATAAAWDHKLYEGNNPLLGGVLVHHVAGTDPKIPQAVNIQLLDLNNPGNEPNDGIMYTLDEYFHAQSPAASVVTKSGEVMSATHSFEHLGHMEVSTGEAFRTLAAAGLFHRRKVVVTLESVTLHQDREFSIPDHVDEQGSSPAELVVETQVRYDPYTVPAFGKTSLVQDDQIAYRSPELRVQAAGASAEPKLVLFAGPVFDEQTSLRLDATLVEADLFPRWNVAEALLFTPNRELAKFGGVVTLADQTLHVGNAYADFDLSIHVVEMY